MGPLRVWGLGPLRVWGIAECLIIRPLYYNAARMPGVLDVVGKEMLRRRHHFALMPY